MTDGDTRWIQRFRGFFRAYSLLREALEEDPVSLSQLEKEGIIKRFEYTFELTWKVLKDKLEHDGLVLNQISPKAVIRQAYAAKFIDRADTWMNMIGDRILVSHTYDFRKLEAIVQTIRADYLPLLSDLDDQLDEEVLGAYCGGTD